MKRRSGFAFVMTAFTLSLIILSHCFAMIYLLPPVYIKPSSEAWLEEEAYRSVIIGAGVAASKSQDPEGAAEAYINSSLKALSQISALGINTPQFNGTGIGKREAFDEEGPVYNVIYKYSNGNGEKLIKVLNLPPGGEVLLADRDLNIILRTNSNLLDFNREPGEYYLLLYTKDSQRWGYSGTISTTYKYILKGSSIVTSTWNPPVGFPYILIYGVPQLGLVEVYDTSNAPIAESLKDLWSNMTVAVVPLSFPGRISVTLPNAWYYGWIDGGEVFVYG